MRARVAIVVACAALVGAGVGAPRVVRADDDVRAPAAPPPAKPAGVVTKPPVLVQAVAPDYPPAALAAGKTAQVKVRISIDATGVVTAVEVIDKVGDGFDEAATAAAMQYVFDPAEVDGVPAPLTVETTINFTIEKVPEPEAPPAPLLPNDRPAGGGPANYAGPASKPVTLQGTVVERGTRSKLGGVIVSVAELGLDAVTAPDGTFFFRGVPAGHYTLLAVDPKFDRLSQPVVLAAHEAVEVRLWLRPRGGNPYQTDVEGERDTLEVTKRTLQHDQLTSIPGTFGDPIRVIQSLPGLARAPFGLGLLLIRGSNPDDSGIFIDGHELPALFHFLGGPSIFNAEMIDSIDLYPGGFPARFGRFHGGVVTLETRPTESDGVHGAAKVDFLDAGGYLRAPITKDISFAVAGRRSYIDTFLGYVLPQPDNGGQRVVAPVYYDYQGRIDWNLHADGRLSLFAIGSSDTLHVLSTNPELAASTDLNTSTKFFRVIASYVRPLGGDLKLTVSPAYGRDTLSVAGAQAEAAGPFSSLEIVNRNLSFRLRVAGRIDDHFVLDTGLDLLSRVTTYGALLPIDDQIRDPEGVDLPPTQVFRGAQEIGTGGYIDLGIDVTKRLRIVPSLRLDGYVLDGETRGSVDPRVIARYALSPQWTAKAYIGEFSEPPQPEAFDSRFGNPHIGLEHALHLGIGYEWHPDKLWSFDGEVYDVRRRDLVAFTDDGMRNADGSFSYINFVNSGHGQTVGFEALIKRQISPHFFGWLSYTYSHSREQLQAGDSPSPTPFDEPHVLNAVASWKPGHGWEFGMRFQLASGRPTTGVVGSTYDSDAGGYVPVDGPTRGTRLPTFEQLDVRGEHTWIFERWTLGAYLDVINVTNAANVEAIVYDYRYRASAPISSLPILPTLGVRGTW